MLTRQSKVLRELHELIRIISTAGPKKMRGVSRDMLEHSPKPFARLYRILSSDLSVSEEKIFRDLEQVEDSVPMGSKRKQFDRKKYNSLKSRLKVRLFDTLFLLDLNFAGFSQYSIDLFKVNRSMFLARTLVAFGARELAVSVAKSGLAKAMSTEEWSAAMEFLFVLRRNASQIGDSRSHHFYTNEFLHCQQLLAAEHNAELEMERLQLLFARSGGEKPSHAAPSETAAVHVEELALAHPSFKLSFLALRLRAASSQLRMDYATTLETCENAFALLFNYPQFSNRARMAEYAITMLVSATQLHDRDATEKALGLCKTNLKQNENNWFSYKEYEYLFFMRTLRFQEAKEIVTAVIQHDRFYKQTEASQEKWGLFRLYSEFVNHERVPIKTPADFSALVPTLSPDKKGFNTSLIILHILLLADRKQFGELRERIEFIKGYKKRHLRGIENCHAAHFFALLALIETCDLNYKKLARRSSKMLVELRRMEADEPIQGELILPYSYAWNIILDALREYHPLAHN